jgi:hypothetical protein
MVKEHLRVRYGKKDSSGNPESYTITISAESARNLVALLNATIPMLSRGEITTKEDGVANALVNELSEYCDQCPNFGNNRDFHLRGGICDGYNGQEV